ncbi:hypothetical protein [Erythrobacter sp. YT30]|uniref:hypothetical protein n=1 Tax=Erythrobacter sp. YT30 TaxID=1735012 RepID=UPI00076DDD14|nr:hypothetical protein [Erythrobacter sp. YT30]KWV91483.1 hypothetical protein AUC45_09540 [Erythrobacter sp. YT30]
MKKFSGFRARALTASACLLAFGFASSVAAQNLSLEAAQEAPEDEAELVAPPIPEVEAGEVPDGSVGGMGDINLYPRRIIMDRRSRIASVGIYNKTAFDGDYEISITDMVMLNSGNVVPLDNIPAGVEAGEVKVASQMLRHSPRRVALLGSEAQTVRIMARPSADLPDGEYRAHFMVVSVPKNLDEGFSIEDAVSDNAADTGNVGVTIRPRFGISIPVIVRVGDTTLDVGLENIGFVQGERGPLLSMTITRSGTRSAYGDVVVTAPGQDEPLVIARGIGVYPEIDSRQVQLALNPEFDLTQLRAGMQLTATFVDDDVNPGETLARQDFVVR